MEPGMILHLLRNPWGHSDDEVRQARLAAADELERWRRTVDHPGSAVQWIAEMQPQLYALRARVAELEELLRDAHGHLYDYCDENEQAGFRTIATAVAELLTKIEAAMRLSGNKEGSRE